jgi:phage shock protein A
VPDQQPDESASDDVTPDEVPLGDLPVAPEETGYTPGGVPTFDYAREKIETRYGTAIGAAELAAETPEGRTVEQQYEARQRAAADRLAQIRESMHGEASDDA